jgi:hypothetical protein
MTHPTRLERQADAQRRQFADAGGDAEFWQNPKWKTKRASLLSRFFALPVFHRAAYHAPATRAIASIAPDRRHS